MRNQEFPSRLVLMQESLQYEDAEIISHSENEGGENDVHDVELYPENAHHSNDEDPAQQHRQETQHGQLNAAEGQPQDEEDEE